MKRIIILAAVTVFLYLNATAQHQNIVIGETQGNGIPGEPAICINPSNPDEMMVGAMVRNCYTTTDGGYTWSHSTISSPWGVQADPVILCDNDGAFYYLHLPDVIERVVSHRKENILASWDQAISVGYNGTHDVDKNWATYDPVNDRIYLSWTYFDTWGSSNPNDSSCIYISWSDDKGSNWVEAVRISDEKGNALGGNYSMHGSYPATGPNGEIYICWWGPDGLMFDRSLDMGANWLDEDLCITGYHVNWIYSIPGVDLGVSFPVIACDRSGGPNNGNIYICWADQSNGYNDTDIFMVKSEDNGETWSAPMRVNDDPPDRHQFFPFVTVDQVTGKVWMVFYDRRNYPDTETDVYMAVSDDGGENFTNFRVSENSFTPYSSVFYGHYIGLSAHDDHIMPVWMRMDNGYSSLIGAIVDPLIIGQEEYFLSPVARLETGPNPFLESTFISFKLRKASHVDLMLYDMDGELKETIIDNMWLPTGKYVEQINASILGLNPGVYFAKLKADNSIISEKLVLVK